MRKVTFFISFEGRASNDNRERLPRAFSKAGWDVVSVDHESLALANRRLTGMTGAGERTDLDDSSLYFILGFGASHTFLDRMQMLAALEKTRFVNEPESLILDHGKVSLYLNQPEVEQPESYLANDPCFLAGLVESGGDWIAKPPAGSFGRDVYLLHATDTNLRPILESLTHDGRYAMLQRYVRPENEEKRVLAAGGRIIGGYGKSPQDHRGSLQASSQPHRTVLTPDESSLVSDLATQLGSVGIRFFTVDIAFPYVFEINIANPGWLQTWETLTDEDLSHDVVEALS